MAEDMFDGFDHTRYESEVTGRWGADAHRTGDAWWRGMDATDRGRWKAESSALAANYGGTAGAEFVRAAVRAAIDQA